VVAGVSGGLGAAPSLAQDAAVVPPALEARVTPVPTDPVELRVDGFHLEDAGGEPTVVVSFRSPFALPREPWTVAVSVGDPGGERTRTTLVSVAGAEPTGRTERGDGVQWQDLGAADVVAATDAGQVRLSVPMLEASPDAVVWVDVETTRDGEIVASGSPAVALVDLRGGRPGPSLGTAAVAEVVDGGDPGAYPLDRPGPTVRVVGRALEIATTEPAPASVDGVEVVDVIDSAVLTTQGDRIAGGEAPIGADRIEIDRRIGEVRLVADGAEPFVAVPGTTPWLVQGPPPDGAPGAVVIDLDALDDAIGGVTPDRTTTRVAAERLFALDDGRILVAPGVAGTLAWFDGATAAATTPAPDVGRGSPSPTLLAAAVAAVVVAAVVVVAWWRRRRDPAEADDEPRPIDRLDALLAGSAPTGPGRHEPVLVLEPRPGAPAVLILGSEEADAAGSGVESGGESGAGAGEESGAGAVSEAGSGPTGTGDPLTALLAEVDELSARVDGLAGSARSEAGDPR
jgi:hypothetical protein